MKKIVLLLVVLSLVASAYGPNNPNANPNPNGMQMGKMGKKAARQGASKPFLIQKGLPHLTGIIKNLWDDEDLALTQKQKEELLVVRKDTLSGVRSLNLEIQALESEIVLKAMRGETPASLQEKVKKLALLRAEATMVHLRCIYETRKILTKEQLYIVE